VRVKVEDMGAWRHHGRCLCGGKSRFTRSGSWWWGNGGGVGTAADVMTHHYIDDDAVVVTMHGVGRVHVPLGRARKC